MKNKKIIFITIIIILLTLSLSLSLSIYLFINKDVNSEDKLTDNKDEEVKIVELKNEEILKSIFKEVEENIVYKSEKGNVEKDNVIPNSETGAFNIEKENLTMKTLIKSNGEGDFLILTQKELDMYKVESLLEKIFNIEFNSNLFNNEKDNYDNFDFGILSSVDIKYLKDSNKYYNILNNESVNYKTNIYLGVSKNNKIESLVFDRIYIK